MRHGIVATAGQPGEADEIAAWLAAAVRSAKADADGACVFWTEQEEARCIGPDDSLVEPLVVHARGARAERTAADAFRQAGLTVAPGPDAEVLLVAGHLHADC